MSETFVAEVDSTANHTAVRVADVAAMLRFYHELIGLPISRIQGSPEHPQMVWLPGLQLIRRGEGEETAPDRHFDHLALGIQNIEEVCARLDAAGFVAETPLQRRGADEVGRDLKMAFYRDPEGNKVELLKYL